MKGIILISQDEKSRAFIDIQYPSLLCDVEEINPSELLKLYEEKKKEMAGPSYFETKLKDGIILGFFYSGFSLAHYVGKPKHAILVLMSEDDILIDKIEGMIRRIAHELLPQREETVFQALFQDYYDLLKNGELGPYWEEIGEKQEYEMKKTPEMKETLPEIKYQNENDEMEDINEIDSLKMKLKAQEEKLENWSEELANLNENNANLMNKLKIFKEDSDKQKETIEKQEGEIQNLNQLLEEAKRKSEEMEQEFEVNSELKEKAEKSDELKEEIEKKDQEVNVLKEELEEMSKIKEEIEKKNMDNEAIKFEIDSLKKDFVFAEEEIERLKNENERFLSTFTNLKLELKQAKDKIENETKNNEKLKDDIIEMKKEVKVLRRERDHYLDLVKENKLL